MTVVDYATEQQAILSHLGDHWSLTEIGWPNTQFDHEGEEHITAKCVRQEAFNKDINATAKGVRHPGMLIVDIRVPINQGDGRALALADVVAGIFRNAIVDGIHFRAPTVRDDLSTETNWYHVQVTAPYWRDTIH